LTSLSGVHGDATYRLYEDVVTVDERDEGLVHRNVDRLEKLANRLLQGLKPVENFVIGSSKTDTCMSQADEAGLYTVVVECVAKMTNLETFK
jgi:hypothetical protein